MTREGASDDYVWVTTNVKHIFRKTENINFKGNIHSVYLQCLIV